MIKLIGLALCIWAGYAYRWGGDDIKGINWRQFIGVPIGLIYALLTWSWIPLITCITFIQQPPYGEKSYLNFLGEYGKFAVCGFVFGISTLPVYIACGKWWLGIISGVVSALAYVVIKYFDDKAIIDNPWVERLRGFFGTITLIGV